MGCAMTFLDRGRMIAAIYARKRTEQGEEL